MNNHSVSSRSGLRRRRRFSPEQVDRFLDEFERGGGSAATFAREQGLCYTTFCTWRRQRERRGRRRSVPRLEPVPIGSLLGPGWAAEIGWPGGVTLRLHERVSAAWAGALIEALRRPC